MSIQSKEGPHLRGKLGLRQIHLARLLGVSPSSVCRWKDDYPEYALAYLRERFSREAMETRLVIARAQARHWKREAYGRNTSDDILPFN